MTGQLFELIRSHVRWFFLCKNLWLAVVNESDDLTTRVNWSSLSTPLLTCPFDVQRSITSRINTEKVENWKAIRERVKSRRVSKAWTQQHVIWYLMDCRLVWAGLAAYNILDRHVNTVCRLPKQKMRKERNGRAFWLAGNYYSPNTIGNANFMCCLIGAKVGRCFAACRDNCRAENLETFLSTVHLNAKRCFIALIIFKCEKSPNYANRSRTKGFFIFPRSKRAPTRPGLHKKSHFSVGPVASDSNWSQMCSN